MAEVYHTQQEEAIPSAVAQKNGSKAVFGVTIFSMSRKLKIKRYTGVLDRTQLEKRL